MFLPCQTCMMIFSVLMCSLQKRVKWLERKRERERVDDASNSTSWCVNENSCHSKWFLYPPYFVFIYFPFAKRKVIRVSINVSQINQIRNTKQKDSRKKLNGIKLVCSQVISIKGLCVSTEREHVFRKQWTNCYQFE